MKAIQVRYLPESNTKGFRLKAFISKKHFIIEERNGLESDDQALQLANKLLEKLNWNEVEIIGMGVIENGDYVFTLKNKECELSFDYEPCRRGCGEKMASHIKYRNHPLRLICGNCLTEEERKSIFDAVVNQKMKECSQ